MLDELFDPSQRRQQDDASLIQELERNTPEEIRRQRAHFRVTVRARVIVQPGNASQVHNQKLQCSVGDLSEGGCRMVAPLPLAVGDIYRLTFNPQELPLAMTFARCMRCQLLREDAYDVGFRFFSAISLPETLVASLESA